LRCAISRSETERDEANQRERERRWAFPVSAKVVTRLGTVVVPCASPYAAVLCAAEELNTDWTQIRDAKVERLI
jgi:hypothetical protein